MTEQWQELKETIKELRDSDGTGTQQEVCKFLANYMKLLEQQIQESETVTEFADRCQECGTKYGKLLEQYRAFAKWIASEIFDENWEYNKDSFAELACRKLANLGIVRAKGDEWELVVDHDCLPSVTPSYNSINTELKPSNDCISRQSVLELIDFYDGQNQQHFTVDNLRDDVENVKPVTPQLKMGKWIAQDIYNCHTDFRCSECGYIHSFMHLYGEPTADYTYCPNCGAKMEEVEVNADADSN